MLDEFLEKNHVDSDSSTSSAAENEGYKWLTEYYNDGYFVLSTGKYKEYKPGEQVFNGYGSRSNKFLLFNYGFMLNHNLYNSFTFRAWVDLEIPDNNKITHISGESMNFEEITQVIRWFKVIRMKEKLNFKLLEYIRSTIISKYKGKNHHLLIVSQSIDFDFEVLVIGCAINLLESLLAKRFTNKTTDVEKVLTTRENLGHSRKKIYQYRLDQKETIKRNINMLQILMRLVVRLKKSRTPRVDILKRIPQFESEEEVISNRLKMRYYIRDLFRNQLIMRDVKSLE